MDFYTRIWFPLLSIMYILISPTASQSDTPFYPPSPEEAFRNTIVGDSHILIGSTTSVHRINPTSLAVEDSRVLGAANRMLVTDPGGTYSGSVLVCTSLECTLTPINNLTDIRWQVPNGGSNGVIRGAGTENVIGSFAPGANGSSSLSFGEQQASVDPSTITRGNLVNVNVTGSSFFLRYATQSEADRFIPREFLATFNSQSFIYFIVRIGVVINGTLVDKLRVVRFCQEDSGSAASDQFVSHFELVAECSGSSSSIPTAATYIGTSSVFGADTFLVAFMAESNGGSTRVQHLCAYDITTINARMMEKFGNCLNGNGLSGFSRDREQSQCPSGLSQPQIENANPCTLPGLLLPGQEVENPLVQQTLMEQPLLGGHFTSIVHNTLDNTQFIFAGTNEGRLYQYHVINSTRSVLVRNIMLQFSSSTGTNETNVTQLRASSDGQHIYVLTPKKLIKHQVDMCEGFTTCETCISSADPICGWCSLERRCTRQVNCSHVGTNQLEWRTSVDQCPAITRAEPPIIFFPQLMNGRTITLQTSNIPTGLNYQCVFDFGNLGDRVEGSATHNGDQVTCTVPTSSQIPDLPAGQDTVNSNVSLRYTNGVDFVTLATPVGFTDCSVHTSCPTCINSPQNCGWCPFSFQCLPHQLAGVSCQGSEETMNNSCPAIRPHSLTSNYLVHTNYTYPRNQLTIEAENLHNFADRFQQGQFWCVICTGSNCLFNLSASLNPDGTVVTCDAMEFRYPGNEAIVNATLRVVWSVNNRNIDNPQNAGVTLYSCPQMGTNCAQCLSIPSAYNCSHCSTSGGSGPHCMFEDMCGGTELNSPSEVGQCGAPIIEDFFPKSGPLDGGTEITITGTNLGAKRSDILFVRIDGVDCLVTDYQPGVSIKCVTDEVSRLVSDVISIQFDYRSNLATSQERFTYEIPSLTNTSTTPNKGPQSGGTNITIQGENLGIGSFHNISIANRECRIHKIRENSIMCETPPSDVVSDRIIITVSVDNWRSRIRFAYVADPTFESISPNFSFASGGTYYNITGTNLDSVEQPRLLFYVEGVAELGMRWRQTAGQNYVESPPCTVDAMNPSRMQCLAPRVMCTNGSVVQTPIGLLMDGVRDLLMLNSTVTVHPNPSFMMFKGVQEFSRNKDIILTIQGEGFVFTQDQIYLEITSQHFYPTRVCTCTVLNDSFNTSTLKCEIDRLEYLLLTGLYNVTIRLGNQVQFIGMIQIILDLAHNIIYIFSPLFGFSVGTIALIVVLVALRCCKIRQKLRKQDQLLTALLRAEHQQIEMATESIRGTVSGFQVTDEFMAQLPQQLIIPSSHLQLFESVGQGEFGVVYRGKLLRKQGRSKPGFVAVKTMRGLFTPNDVQNMMDEVLKMLSFDHPHVMTLIGVCLDAGPGLALVMPYMANGSLLAYLKNERPNLDLSDDAELEAIFSVRRLLLRICHQIALGMEYLALQMFVHRDLAARNCMLDSGGDIKVSDFGLAEDVYTRGYFRQSNDDSGNVRLPYKWIPPESFQDGIFSEKSDVWAFSVTCWEVFMAGRTPYPALDPTSLLRMLESGQRLEKPPNAACPTEVYSVMRKCWRADPAERPTFSELASILDRLLQSVAGYVELTMTLPASEAGPEEANIETADPPDAGEGETMSDDDVPMERYGASDGVLVLETPAYSRPSVSLPAATPQPPTTATAGDEEYEPAD